MSRRTKPSEIAVIGLACHYPDARNPRQLWENILARRRQFRPIPDCRMPLGDYYDPDPRAEDKTYGRLAALIDGFEFDWAERRIPLSTLQATDMVHWLALEVGLAAVTDAGYTREQLPGERTGVIVGNTLTGEQTRANTMRLRWPFVRRALGHAVRAQELDDAQAQALSRILEQRYKSAFPAVDEDTLAGGLSNTIAGRICNYLNLMGGGFTVDGACSSSLLAVAHAAARIADGDLDLALVGGVDISLDPFELVGFAKTGALTAQEMRVYDRSGSGFIPGEGCGFMVLKPLEAARRDGDRVYALIQGWGISSDGGGTGITAPNAAGQALALERAYLRAPHGIADLDFIEGHGTGTTVGDRIELEAIARVIGHEPVPRGQLRPCGMTSIKSIIGHTKAASGIAGLIKAVMAVNRRVVPPTAACIDPHPVFDGAAQRLYPLRLGRQEPAQARLTAGVSAMGFGGINCHVTLTSADGPDDRLAPVIAEGALLASAQESELLLLGAGSKTALLKKIGELTAASQGISRAELADLAADQSRRVSPDDKVRAAVVAQSPEALGEGLGQLEAFLSGPNPPTQTPFAVPLNRDIWLAMGTARPRLGYLFPGQGSQQFNMGRTLVQRFDWARHWVAQADRIAGELAGEPVSALVYRETDRAPSAAERQAWSKALSRTQTAQPAICLTSLLWLTFLERLGLHPEIVGGHSLGELSACYAAGIFDGPALLEFALSRGLAMADPSAEPGAMVSLRCGEAEARALIPQVEGYLTLANLNSPTQTVLSGEPEAVAALIRLAKRQGISTRKLPVSGAFHSRLCTEATLKVLELPMLDREVGATRCQILSSMTGQPLQQGSSLKRHFSEQICSQVDFMGLVQQMAPHCDLLIEVGPGRVLSGLANEITKGKGPLCLPVEGAADHATDLNRLLGALYAHGAQVHWEGVYENRLIRPFVPPEQKNFVINPCETLTRDETLEIETEAFRAGPADLFLADALVDLPPDQGPRYLAARGEFLTRVVKADLAYWDPQAAHPAGTLPAAAAGPPPAAAAQASLFQMVAEVTGFASESLTRDARLLDDLNLDSIKAGDLIARFAKSCGVIFPDPALLANATLGEVLDAARQLQEAGWLREAEKADPGSASEPAARPASRPEAQAELLRQAAQVTGFSRDLLNPELKIEADLQMGPDKLKIMIQRTAAALGIEANVDLEPLLTRSLGEISGILERMLAASTAAPPKLPPSSRGESDSPLWVRNFVLEPLETPYPEPLESWQTRWENNWEKARVLILHSADTRGVAGVLGHHLFQRGAFTQVRLFDAADAAAAVQDAAFSHLVAIIPKSDPHEMDRATLLQRLIRIRASVVPMPPAALAPRRRTTVAWIQFGGGFFGRDPRFAKLNRCGAVALGASLHLERPDLRVRVLDFSAALSSESVARNTLKELVTPPGFDAVGYDLDHVRRTLAAQVAQPARFKKREIPWSAADVILVTGGAKGITAVCALAAARATGSRMALVGRSPHPDQAPEHPGSGKIRALLAKYADLGLGAEYIPCDMADRSQVAEMLIQVNRRLGPVTGIIHGAGLNRPRTTGQVPPDQAFAETAPKVLGLLHLLDHLQEQPPKLIVGMGSIIGITGMPGNGWYGFSNEVMDIALRGFAADHPQTRTVNVAYSIWRDEGMGARLGSVKLLREKGIEAIPTEEGVKRFVNIFTHDPGHAQVVVTARLEGMDTWRQRALEASLEGRFLETSLGITPGIEAHFGVQLTLKRDLYLKDHQFQGSYLFPTVFGLEAMAQAALYLLGQSEISRIQFRDVHLRRPITVDPVEGAEIEIRALLKEISAEGETVVACGIAKRGTGIGDDYFSARLVFNPAQEAPEINLDIPKDGLPLIPRTDLYRSTLLFQGVRFQGIQKIWKIDQRPGQTGAHEGQALFASRVLPAAEGMAAAFGDQAPNRLFLGDPFFTDTLLQSAALLVPQDTCLPVSIERMDLFPEFFNADSPARVQTELVGREGQDLIYRVAATSEGGTPRAMLSGYRLRILKHHDDYPSVADLTSPEARDRRLVKAHLEAACRKLGLALPILELSTLPEIHKLKKAERRAAERPLLERTLAAGGRRYQVALSTPKIQWQDSGKPSIEGIFPADLDLSLTHEDRTCLCVCAPGPLGCDLAAITPRSREAWNGLLGSRRSALLDALIDKGEALDRAGTRIWAATETLAKAGGPQEGNLQVERTLDEAVLFAAKDERGHELKILTLPLRLTWGAPLILALTVTPEAISRVPEHLISADYPGYEALYETRPFEMIEGGPQGQLIFVQRLPVTFQPSANLSRTIYFSNFIKWMGNTREASAWPVLGKMSEEFASGRWGGVTNWGHLKILGEGGTSDQVEVLMWVSDNSGPENSTMTLSYDFRRLVPGAAPQRLAFCRLQTTWVEILGPGKAKVAPYPAYYGQFIDDMCPRYEAPDIPQPLRESLEHLAQAPQDALVFTAPRGSRTYPQVKEQTFETSLAQANLVGNIYYAHYYAWQGQIRDRFFYELIPDYYGGTGEKGELLALESRVDHLREIMPFDRVLLTLGVKELRRCSVTFHLDYFRVDPDGSRLKIAYGLHRAVWIVRDTEGRPQAAPFPDPVRGAFEAALEKAT